VIQFLIVVVIGLLVYMAVGDDVNRIFRRRAEAYRDRYEKYVTRAILLPAIVFLALGLVMRDIVLTPFVWLVGVALTTLRVRQQISQAGVITPRMVSQLVIAFRAAYQLQPAAFSSLEEAAKKIGEPLSGIIEIVVDVFYATSDPERAFAEFRRRTDSVLMHQFAYILEMSESASDESVTEALDAFVTRLRRQEDLQREVDSNLSSVTSQTSFMQTLAIVVGFAVALVPGFRQAYTGSLLGRLGYMALVAVIAGASYYIERRVFRLKEQIV